MARYKLTISCEFDDAYPVSCHTNEARAILNMCCPWCLGLKIEPKCTGGLCFNCWMRALSEGVRADAAENVHVERLG